MSSVFTFDPDPPKALVSPWPVPASELHRRKSGKAAVNDQIPSIMHLTAFGVKSLEPEPQDGPTEYKLHLLLRPRRSFSALSTVQKVSGSHLSKSRAPRSENGSPSLFPKGSAASASSTQSRQSRLQNLTTQLLWRLQQSSPHHSASKSDLVVPLLPEAFSSMGTSTVPGKLLPGLGDSQGALYEIGVADDGTLVGLTIDELDESLAVLRAMASSLGCKVTLLRRIIVGDCQWLEKSDSTAKIASRLRKEKLWVAEVLVNPDLPSSDSKLSIGSSPPAFEETVVTDPLSVTGEIHSRKPATDQLRVTLTGSTTSGKSSLLGTLSTSTLDNGRGKSRLSLLKHRHEISSGMTSSVTGSLIGYHDVKSAPGEEDLQVQVINYASGNVSSWTDIHSAAAPGRLVFLNDSAGHPRFRRTTVRGLVSWAPHWTICCIAADNEEDARGKVGATASAADVLGSACAEIDLAKAHLELCLNLGLPLIVVITKLDLASVSALKPTLGKILSLLKSAGRRPEILSCASEERSFRTQEIDQQHELEVIRLLTTLSEADPCSMVPIVLISAVTGKGMDTLHALLRHLPIPERALPAGTPGNPINAFVSPDAVFHVDEIFAAHNAPNQMRQGMEETSIDSILSGYLHRGSLSIGQEVIIGPFSTNSTEADVVAPEVHQANSFPRIKGSPKTVTASRILPRPLSADFTTTHQTVMGSVRTTAVWRRARVCSIRNLRLPVHHLQADHAGGTVGLGPSVSTVDSDIGPLTAEDRIRKGMVLMSMASEQCNKLLQAFSGFVAIAESRECRTAYHAGSSVIAYIASIRAPAKVLESRMLPEGGTLPSEMFDFEEDAGGDDETPRTSPTVGETGRLRLVVQFLTCQEWFEVGSKVLVMPASGFGTSGEKGDRASTGLDGLVGRITQGLE